MQNLNQTYFTTGEFSKIWGIKKQTLFHYDDIGIFKPAIKKSNGYRYYSYQQFEVFWVISVLKEMGMPLQEIKVYLDHRSPEQLMNLFTEKMNQIDKEIHQLIRMKQMMKEKIELTKHALAVQSDKIEVQTLEEEYLTLSPKMDSFTHQESFNHLATFMKREGESRGVTLSSVGSMLAMNELNLDEYFNYSYFYVRVASKYTDDVFIKPAGEYLVAYHRGNFEEIYLTYQRMIDFAKENHLEFIGYAYEDFILDEASVIGYENYLTQVQIQVRKK